MIYRLLADLVVLAHFLWIMFLIFGAFPGRKYETIKIFHIGGVIFALAIQILGWYCPLTHIEIWLRRMHDPALSYSGSFIVHYVEKIVYINLSARTILIMTIVLVMLSVWLYLHKSKDR